MQTLTDAQVARLLVGHEVAVGVSEPWDFEGPDGPNALRGTVAEVILGADDPDAPPTVVVRVTPFRSEEGVVVDRLVAAARHARQGSILRQLAAGERPTADLSYAELVPEGRQLQGKVPKLIGSVRLA